MLKKLILVLFISMSAYAQSVLQINHSDYERVCSNDNCTALDTDEVEAELLQQSNNEETESSSREISLRLIQGTDVHRFIGSAGDYPRNYIAGLSAGIVFCRGMCHAYISALTEYGTNRTDLVRSRLNTIRTMVAFYLLPISWGPARLGLGIELGVGGQFNSHVTDTTEANFKILNGHLAFGIELKVDIKKFNTDRGVIQLALGSSFKVIVDRNLVSCETYEFEDSSRSRCYGASQLQTVSAPPIVTGGALLGNIFLELRFGGSR